MKIIISMSQDLFDVNPRSFRVLELAKELKRRGHYVTIISLNKRKIYSHEETLDNIIQNERPKEISVKKVSKIKISIFYLLSYLIYDVKIFTKVKYLKKNLKKFLNYDVALSISPTFVNNIAIALSKFSKGTVKIFDCGDPFYYNVDKIAPYWKFIAKKIYNKADFVCVPIEKALLTYYKLVKKEKLRVIPQGIDFSSYEICEYKKNAVPTFIYTGNFYREIRNPIIFLDFLSSLNEDFCFKIYTSENREMLQILKEYEKKLNGKMKIYPLVSRKECIKLLSQSDFIVNFENLVEKQLPSKLIDYGIAKRPVISFSSKTFNKEIFMQFLKGDYTNKLDIDITKYDIKKVADQFEEIFKLKRGNK